MAEMLVIQIDNPDAGTAVWIPADGTGAITGPAGTGTLAEAAAAAADRAVAVLVPATDVLRTKVSLPLKGNARIRQALPFAMEEQLAQDVENLHFAIGERDSDGLLSVAVCEQSYLADAVAKLQDAGLQPASLHSTADALPGADNNSTTLWINQGNAIIADASGNLAIDSGELETVLELRFPIATDDAEADTNQPVNVFCDEDSLPGNEDLLEKLRLRVSSLDIKIIENSGIAQLANGLGSNKGVNLLQDRFAAKRERIALSPAWRIAAALLMAFGLLLVAGDALTLMKLKQQEAALDLAARDTLTRTFPTATNAADPWGLLQSRLKGSATQQSTAGPGLIEALNVLADAVEKTQGLKIEALSFRGGVIDLRLEAPGVDVLDKLTQTVNSSSIFQASIQSANPSGEIIQGRMQIKAAGQ